MALKRNPLTQSDLKPIHKNDGTLLTSFFFMVMPQGSPWLGCDCTAVSHQWSLFGTWYQA